MRGEFASAAKSSQFALEVIVVRKTCPAVVLTLAFLSACSAQPAPESEAVTRRPQRNDDQHPGAALGHILAADVAAIAGDRDGVRKQMKAAQDAFRRDNKIPDSGRVVDHELARVAAKRVAGVRSAVWLDRENLLLIVSENAQKSYETIDQVCMELEPLGDTLGVVVNLQSGAATNGDELEILSRNCQLDPGDRAFMRKARQVDVLSPKIRAQHKANNAPR